MDKVTIWASLLKNMQDTMDKCGFSLYYPGGNKTPDLPFVPESDDGKALLFSSESGAVKISYDRDKFSLFFSNTKIDENGFAEFSREEQALLESETATDKDIKWLASEFSEAVNRSFGTVSDTAITKKNKLPQTVSKAAAKSGEVSYDLVTLASRFTVCYSELREQYRLNVEKYKEFQSEEFFMEYGVPAVMNTIKENNPQKMKKLFNILNDLYEFGTNETQNMIVVTILGDLHKDKNMLNRALPYMEKGLATSVTEVCKYLSSGRSASDRAKLINPPAYKPKKKKGSLMNRLMGKQ